MFIQMNAGVPIESSLALERFRSVRNPQKLQTQQETDIDEQALGFWDTIFGLVLEGRLNEIWDILILHGELVSLISSATGDRASADSRVLQAIHDILNSHPVALLAQQRAENCTSVDSAIHSNSAISPNVAVEFKDWKDKVSRVLQSSAQVLGRVSELATLLLLLSGDNDTILEYARGDWVTYALCSLLYVHPPSLTRSNITQVLLVSMRSAPPTDAAADIEALRYEIEIMTQFVYKYCYCNI
jgi:Nup85 Nucleoporin